jgi:hypothetical protein
MAQDLQVANPRSFSALLETATNADLDRSRLVNFTDLAIFRQMFGKKPGPSGMHPTP